MTQLTIDLNMDQLLLQPLVTFPNEIGKKLMLDKENISEFNEDVRRARKIAEEMKLVNNLHEIDNRLVEESANIDTVIQSEGKKSDDFPESLYCFSPWLYIGIKAEGEVSASPAEIVVDNIKNKTLKECWDGEGFQEIRGKMKTGDLNEICKACCPITIMSMRSIRENIEKIKTSVSSAATRRP